MEKKWRAEPPFKSDLADPEVCVGMIAVDSTALHRRDKPPGPCHRVAVWPHEHGQWWQAAGFSYRLAGLLTSYPVCPLPVCKGGDNGTRLPA